MIARRIVRPWAIARRSLAAAALVVALATAPPLAAEPTPYHSPLNVAFSPTGEHLAVCDYTANILWLGDCRSAPPTLQPVDLEGSPVDVVWLPDARHCLVAMGSPHTILLLNAIDGTLQQRWSLGASPSHLALAPQRNLLLVTLRDAGEVVPIDLASPVPQPPVSVKRQPRSLAITPDGSTALIAHFLPADSLDNPQIAATISLLNLDSCSITGELRLPTGSTLVRQVTLDGTGRWAFVVHLLARFMVPVSQLDRAWVNSNALTILDLGKQRVHATLLLDQFGSGAAEPWGAALSPDGQSLYITLAGVHQIARIAIGRIFGLLDGSQSPPASSSHRPSIWQEISRQPEARTALADDLDALTQAGAIERYDLPARGPRGLALSPNGRTLVVASYFAGELLLLDADPPRLRHRLPLGSSPPPQGIRLGEAVFHDATFSMQHWLSCSTCHPDGRVDGLNWDLMNDGIANPKNTKSLVWASRTPPVMALAVRSDMETAAQAGFRYTQNHEPDPQALEAVRAYIRSLQPVVPPPPPADSLLADQIQRGQEIFNSADTGCAYCHPPPLFTDLQTHRVGTGLGSEAEEPFDTPTLVEIRSTAPYLHHGRAATLEELLTQDNPNDEHGRTSQLSSSGLHALIAYLQSL